MTSNEVKANLVDYFKRIGVQMIDLKFEGIDTTPEFRDRLFWLKTGRVSPDEVIRMETVKDAAASLGKSTGGGAAFGAGMVLVPPLFQTSGGTAPAIALVVCPNCQAHIPSTSKFCPNCGTSISSETQPTAAPGKKCPKVQQRGRRRRNLLPKLRSQTLLTDHNKGKVSIQAWI